MTREDAMEAMGATFNAAVFLPERAVTWLELGPGAERRARQLATLGVKQGSRIAVAVEPSLLAAELLSATQRMGADFVPLPVRPAPGEHEHLADLAGATLITTEQIEGAEETEIPARPLDLNEPQLIIFTSGSSGEPRGIELTRKQLTTSAFALTRAADIRPTDRYIACLPFHHIGGCSIFVRSSTTGFGVKPVWPFDEATVIEESERFGITGISLVPTMLRRLLDAGWTPNPDLRMVLIGGAPCPVFLVERAIAAGFPIATAYGMTETGSAITFSSPEQTRTHPGSVGMPIPGAQVVVGATPTDRAPLDEPGPIWVRGPMVAHRTLGGPLGNAEGWLLTDDVGVLDDEGILTVLGRADDMILSGGENIAPRTIEDALASHPALQEIVVVGVPDDTWGEAVVAVVQLGEPTSAESLQDLAREHLAPHEVPKAIVVVEEMPMLGLGKPNRIAAADLAREHLGRSEL